MRLIEHCTCTCSNGMPALLCLQCSNESVFGVDFHPTDCSVIITCGKSHLYFWSLEKSVLVKKQGLFEVGHPHAASQMADQYHNMINPDG